MNPRSASLAVVAVILFGSVAVTQPHAGAQTTGIPASFFGITLNASTTAWPPDVPFGTLGKTASGGPGGGTYWSSLEPSNNTFTWASLDNLLAAAKTGGVSEVLYTFFETPAWASSNPTQSCFATANFNIYGCAAPPRYLGDWDRFVTALVTRYRGQIKYYELWNEPNVQSEYSGNVTEMVSMARDAYSIMKSVDPSAELLAPGVSLAGIQAYTPGCNLSECWLATYLKDGGASYADGASFHGKTCTADNQICVQEGISCPAMELPACEDLGLKAQIDDVRTIMAASGLSGKPLINTEGGYSDEVGMKALWGSEEHQTAFLSRFYIVQASEGVTVAIWFSWLSNRQSGITGFGTTEYVAQNNQAYTTVRSWLLGSSFAGPCADEGGMWSCSLVTSVGQHDILAWAENDSLGVAYSPGQPAQYQDINGTTHQGVSSIRLTEDPILIEESPSTATSSGTSSGSSTVVSATTTMHSTRSTTVIPTSAASTTSTASRSTSGGGIQEFDYRPALMVIFTLLVVAFYLTARRGDSRGGARGPTPSYSRAA